MSTTFSNDPDDRDEMIVHLRDNVQRLVSQARHSDRSSAPVFLRLLDQRRDWIKGELDVEALLTAPPKAPLGIPETGYDLATLTTDPIDDRCKTYARMIEMIDSTMSDLWEKMLGSEESGE